MPLWSEQSGEVPPAVDNNENADWRYPAFKFDGSRHWRLSRVQATMNEKTYKDRGAELSSDFQYVKEEEKFVPVFLFFKLHLVSIVVFLKKKRKM